MKKVSVMVGVLAALLANAAANAAVLEGIAGGVKINRGEGYSSVKGTTDLSAGDRVMVGRGGNARVVYSDGCRVSLPAGSVTTIPATSPCAWRAQAGGGPDLGGMNPLYVVGGLLVVGGIAGGLAATSGGGGCTNRLYPISGGAIAVCN